MMVNGTVYLYKKDTYDFCLFQDVCCVFFSGGFVFSDYFLLKKTSSTNIKFLMKLQLINSTKKTTGKPMSNSDL